MTRSLTALLGIALVYACERGPSSGPIPPEQGGAFPLPREAVSIETPPPPIDYDTAVWTELLREDSTILLDLRYATVDNFMERRIYDCGRCFYRPAVAKALLAVQRDLTSRGLGLKMFDCYRPGPYQQRLWDVMPDARFVAPPARGSVHSRGAAADLTLVRLADGQELDMGTPYDYFGPEAYTTNEDLPPAVRRNRELLQERMRAHGFSTIRTEWWHFNFNGPRHPLADWVWPCPET